MIIVLPYWLPILALLDISKTVLTSEYGYDAASACGRELRKERARELPCDFEKQNWCTVAGKTYPWQAVRRFVEENHGLMRRMYGDERHLSVIQQEIDYDQHAESTKLRYSQKYRNLDSARHKPKMFYSDIIDANIYTADDENEALDDEPKPRFLHQDDVLMNTKFTFADAEFRPNDLFTSRFRPTSKPLGPDPVQDVSNDLEASPSGAYTVNNFTVLIIEEKNKTVTTTTTTTTETPMTENTTMEEATEYLSTPDDSDTITTATENSPEENITTTKLIKLVPVETVSTVEEPLEDVRVEEEIQGQLFQDQEVEETKDEPLKLKGVNACPVKEEVVAPFWANNTRGEILALLNLYPFEQYVHWEKCTFEHKQMYCRDGCRCEQQYRLHRLLAYDPNNECRGIFSDWFKFPSCCVCKCYDLPAEFRVTSRSPRLGSESHQRRAKIDPAWYRPPSNDDSFL